MRRRCTLSSPSVIGCFGRRRHDGDVHAQAGRGLGHPRHGTAGSWFLHRDVLAGEHRVGAVPSSSQEELGGVDDHAGVPKASSSARAQARRSSKTSRRTFERQHERRPSGSRKLGSTASTCCSLPTVLPCRCSRAHGRCTRPRPMRTADPVCFVRRKRSVLLAKRWCGFARRSWSVATWRSTASPISC